MILFCPRHLGIESRTECIQRRANIRLVVINSYGYSAAPSAEKCGERYDLELVRGVDSIYTKEYLKIVKIRKVYGVLNIHRSVINSQINWE